MEKLEFNWEIIGHQNVVGFLKTSLLNQKISHAYLFSGPANLGKTTTARLFINSLLCENFKEGSGSVPCLECRSCQQFKDNIHPDLYWIQRPADDKNIGIEQVHKELNLKVTMSSFFNSFKIGVIANAEELSNGAANSLLKTLEEPKKKVILILISDRPHDLPLTILSRCLVINFNPVPREEIYQYLLTKIKSKAEAEKLTELAHGQPGLAINYLNNPKLLEDRQETISQFIELIEGSYKEKFSLINSLLPPKTTFGEQFQSLNYLINVWLSVLRDLILIKNNFSAGLVNKFYQAKLIPLARRFELSALKEAFKDLNLVQSLSSQNVQPKLLLENFALNISL